MCSVLEARYAVCHGHDNHEPHRVSLMTRDGAVLHTFGGPNPGSQPHQLNRPIHLATDPATCLLYVLDSGNHAVKVLSTTNLELLDVILTDELKDVDARRIYLDLDNRQLAIAVEDGRVLMFRY